MRGFESEIGVVSEKVFEDRWGVRGGVKCCSAQKEQLPPHTSSVSRLLITLLPKLDLNVFPMQQRGRSALHLRSRAFEVHGNFRDVAR